MRIVAHVSEWIEPPACLVEAAAHLASLEGKGEWEVFALALLFSVAPESSWRSVGPNNGRAPMLPSPTEIAEHLRLDPSTLIANGYFLKRTAAMAVLRDQQVDPRLLSTKKFKADHYRKTFLRPPSKLNNRDYIYTHQEIAHWLETNRRIRLRIGVPTILRGVSRAKSFLDV